jgi:mRNA interferase MazF
VILQANEFNESMINTIIVVALTTNTALALASGNILIRPRESGFKKVSAINVSQMITVNKDRLSEKVKMISDSVMSQVESGVKLVLGL